jgi:hypothetical protein
VPEGFLTLGGRTKFVIGALVATILIDVFAMSVDVREIQLMNRLLDGDLPSSADLDANDDRQALAGTLLFVSFVVTIVAFVMWFSRAYKNLPALGATDLRFTKGWAIGAWFVPILNLWRPKQIANDIWRASDPAAPADQRNTWREKPAAELLLAWWIVWVVSLYAWNASTRLAFAGDDAGGVRDGDYADIVSLGLDLVAALLAIAVVRRMTDRQSARARVVAAAAPLGVEPTAAS